MRHTDPVSENSKKPDHEIIGFEERPESFDWECFVCDLARAMKRHGFSVGFPWESSSSVVFIYEDVKRHLHGKQDLSKAEWLENYFKNYLTLKQLAKDWGEYLRGERGLKTFTAQYCFDVLLKDYAKTSENAGALSKAFIEELPMERQRYLGQSSDEYAEIVAAVKAQEWMSQETAAAFLAPYLRRGTCSSRYIRRLADQEDLRRNKLTGKIRSSSLIDYRNRLVQS